MPEIKIKPYHTPVLVEEVLNYLNPTASGTYVDATFGSGGHTKAILEYAPQCKVIAFDWDLAALEMNGEPLQEKFGDRLNLVWGNFTLIDKKLQKAGIDQVDGILADFGTSFYQLTERPGFSFFKDSPLDMRMSPAHQKTTASYVINKLTENELIHIFKEYGQEPKSRAVARLIVQERKKKRIKTTKELVFLVERVLGPKRGKIHPATKIFQALRIYVNRELENIAAFLPAALRVLKQEGRLVCISFHSLEDRIVKQFFKEKGSGDETIGEILTPKAVMPNLAEMTANPACRSAKLRALKLKKVS